MTKKTATNTAAIKKTANRVEAKVKPVKEAKSVKAEKTTPGFEVCEVTKLVQFNKVNKANKNRIVFLVKDTEENFYITMAFNNQQLADLMISRFKGAKITNNEDNQIIKFTEKIFKSLDIDDAVVASVDNFIRLRC